MQIGKKIAILVGAWGVLDIIPYHKMIVGCEARLTYEHTLSMCYQKQIHNDIHFIERSYKLISSVSNINNKN